MKNINDSSQSDRKERGDRIIERLNSSLEGYVNQVTLVLRIQVHAVLDSFEKTQVSKGYITYTSNDYLADMNQINSTLTRMFEENKKRLKTEYIKNLESLKADLNELCNDQSRQVMHRLDEIVDIELLIQKTREIASKFDAFCIEFKEKVKQKLKLKMTGTEEKSTQKRFALNKKTDFNSDTELLSHKEVSERKCLKLFKNLNSHNEAECLSSDNEDYYAEGPRRLQKSNSVTEMDRRNLIMVSKNKLDGEFSDSSTNISLNSQNTSSFSIEVNDSELEVRH